MNNNLDNFEPLNLSTDIYQIANSGLYYIYDSSINILHPITDSQYIKLLNIKFKHLDVFKDVLSEVMKSHCKNPLQNIINNLKSK